jgi:hypothetical protein
MHFEHRIKWVGQGVLGLLKTPFQRYGDNPQLQLAATGRNGEKDLVY